MPESGRALGAATLLALTLLARTLLALTLLALTLLAGCARIPTSGPVVAGPQVDQEAGSGLRFQPANPAPGASPTTIVRTFLLAASGVEEDHEVARAYLTPRAAEAWRPGTGTLVYDRESLSLTATVAGRPLPEDEFPEGRDEPVTVRLAVHVVATVDAAGRYHGQPPGTVRDIGLEVRPVDGQWRIDGLPDLLVIDDDGFDLAFSAHQLYFVDPTVSFLVPETRWLPSRRSIATTLTAHLLAGPSDWLAGAVRTGFPAGVQLTAPAAVTVEEGEARVDLTRPALRAPAEDRALMQAQLQATLRPLPGVSTVRMTVESGDLVLPGPRPALVQDPTVDPVAVAMAGDRLVEVRDDAIVPLDGLPVPGGGGVSHPGKGGASFAVLGQQRSQLLHLVPGGKAAEPLLVGADLTPPSFDPRSWIWSTSAQCGGVVTAARPGGDTAKVEAQWLTGRRVTSLRVSHDGTRALVVSTGADGLARIDLAGVQRLTDGRPVTLVPALDMSVMPAVTDARDAVWTGESGVAVLGRRAGDSQPRVELSQPLGVVETVEAAVPGPAQAVDVAAGPGERSILVGTADGHLWQRAGSQWLELPLDQPVRDAAFEG
jgi:hypothetical protein